MSLELSGKFFEILFVEFALLGVLPDVPVGLGVVGPNAFVKLVK